MAACGMYHQQGNHQMKILDLLLQLEAAAPPIVPHTHHCLMVALLKAPTPDTQTSSQAGLALETGTCSTPGHSGDNHIHEYSCSDFIPVTQ